MIEIKIELQEKQKLFSEAIDRFAITGYGGAKGGGKSHGIRNIMLLRRFKYPGSIGRIFRRTFPELEDNHIRPLLTQFPSLSRYYNESKKTLTLPNGSVLHFNHCQHEKDVFLYQGRETHDLAIDQAEQWTHQMFSILRGSNRSSMPGVPAKTLLTFNPGDVGHVWLKRLFITKKYTKRENEKDYFFIQALVDDNHALLYNDPDYVLRLDSEPNEALRKAYRFGDWDIFAGQYFTELSRDVHLIPPFNIPEHWTRFGAYDFGFNHPGAFGWFAVDEDGNVYLYREFIKAKLRVDQFCKKIKEYPDTAKLYPIVAGHDCWTKRDVLNDQSPPTIAEEFLKNDIILKRATIDRVQGATQLRNYLAWQNKGIDDKGAPVDGRPRLYIFDTCPITYDCIARMIHDSNNVEDVKKVDASEGDDDGQSGDDPYDMTRYAMMTRPALPAPKPVRHPWGSEKWSAEQVVEMERMAEDHFKRMESQEEGFGI